MLKIMQNRLKKKQNKKVKKQKKRLRMFMEMRNIQSKKLKTRQRTREPNLKAILRKSTRMQKVKLRKK